METPSSLYLSFNIFLQIHDSTPLTLQKAVIFLLIEFQIYFLTPQAEFVCVQNGFIDIQLNLRDQIKRGPLLCCHLAYPLAFPFDSFLFLLPNYITHLCLHVVLFFHYSL